MPGSRRRGSLVGFSAPDLPTFTCKPVAREREIRRGSAKERGYDAEWGRVSKWHLGREPLCRECVFRGRVKPADLTNHIVPVRDRPDLRLDRTNFSSACKDCHDTVIRRLEAKAREIGDILLLREWMHDPATRPEPFAYDAKGVPPFVRRQQRHEERSAGGI